jgi:hypothetical protein
MRKVFQHPTPVRLSIAMVLFLGVVAGPAPADTILQPTLPWFYDTTRIFSNLAFGETIKVPTNGDSRLLSFGLSIAKPPNAAFEATAELYAWDGTKASGPNLYQSPLTQLHDSFAGLTSSPPGSIFQTGGVDLKPGAEYVIFLNMTSPSGFYTSFVFVNGKFANGYPDGAFVSTSPDPATWTTRNWGGGLDGAYDIGFKATFTSPPAAIPEPASFLTCLIGLGLVGFVYRKAVSAGVARCRQR